MDDEWMPANDVERAMAEALGTADRRSYFQVLAQCPLFLPQVRDAGDPTDGQQLVTATLFGQQYLLAFTSVRAMLPAGGDVADSYVTTDYAQLRAQWPVREWLLAVNPGTPIDAYIDIEAVAAAAAGTLTVPTVVEALRQHRGTPGDLAGPEPAGAVARDIDDALADAGAHGDHRRYLDVLLDATVFVPTTREADVAEIGEPHFPWRLLDATEVATVAVLTSAPTPPYVEVAFAILAALWPRPYTMVVNPGSDTSISVPGSDVALLLLVSDRGAIP